MQRAIALAQRALAAGDTPVGSLIVRDDTIVGEGMESVRAEHDIAGHAELIAVRTACRSLGTFDLSACTLYTTAEPCWMCSFAVRQTRIGTVVIGRHTPNLGGVTSSHPLLTDASVPGWHAPPRIVFGVLESECRALGQRRHGPHDGGES